MRFLWKKFTHFSRNLSILSNVFVIRVIAHQIFSYMNAFIHTNITKSRRLTQIWPTHNIDFNSIHHHQEIEFSDNRLQLSLQQKKINSFSEYTSDSRVNHNPTPNLWRTIYMKFRETLISRLTRSNTFGCLASNSSRFPSLTIT